MSTWDDTFWDYSSLTPGEESFANALKPEWQSVYEVMAQVKKDNKSTKNGKTGCLKLIVLEIAQVDRSRTDGVFVCRGPKWTKWSGQSIIHDIQMYKHGASVDEII
jgi:hypothetical protein